MEGATLKRKDLLLLGAVGTECPDKTACVWAVLSLHCPHMR